MDNDLHERQLRDAFVAFIENERARNAQRAADAPLDAQGQARLRERLDAALARELNACVQAVAAGLAEPRGTP